MTWVMLYFVISLIIFTKLMEDPKEREDFEFEFERVRAEDGVLGLIAYCCITAAVIPLEAFVRYFKK